MEFLEKVKGFLTEPSKTFDVLKDEPLAEALKYYAVIALIYSALLALMFAFAGSMIGGIFGSMMGSRSLGMMAGAGMGVGSAIIFFITILIAMIAGVFIGGAIFHIFVYIVGGRKGISQTIKALIYGSTPSLLLGWIPLIGFIAGIWSLVTEIIGIRQLHELSTGKAVLAVLLPLILAIIIAIIFAAAFAFILGSSTHMPYRY